MRSAKNLYAYQIFCAILLATSASGSATTSVVFDEAEPLCESRFLQPLILEDPISELGMRQARGAAREIQPFLADWSLKAENLKLDKVIATLEAMRGAGFDLDGAAFRNLFYVTQRYLLSAKAADQRLRPFTKILNVTEAESRLVVNFVTQLDVFSSLDQATEAWPKFLYSARNEDSFLNNEMTLTRLSTEVRVFMRSVLLPVLGDRLRYARLKVNAAGNQITLQSPVGVYHINMHLGSIQRRSIAPVQVSATDFWGRANDLVIHSQIDIGLRDEEASSYLRTMFRADAFFHPHLIPPTFEYYPMPTRLSPVQKDAQARLLRLDGEVSKRDAHRAGPVEVGLMMPTGEGKTVVAASYIKALQATNWGQRRPKIILVVENIQILQQTVESFQRDFGMDPKKISMLFGELGVVRMGVGSQAFNVNRGSSLSPDPDFDLVVATRTTLHDRHSSLNLWIQRENGKPSASRRPFMFVVDEAHHIGTYAGQYGEILSYLRQNLFAEDRILYLSATLWHPDMNIIRDVLKGAVTGTHLMEDELRQLQRGENLETLARTQFLRATLEGYLNPIDDRSFTVLGNGAASNMDLVTRLRRHEVADSELYMYVADMIRGMRNSGVMDRYLFFEAAQNRARDGADYLQQALGRGENSPGDMHRTSWFVHSGLDADEQNRRVAWFRDRDEFRGSRFQHKYLDTVSQFLEGVDIRGINGIAIMRNLSSNRIVQQVLGRGARLEPFKSGLRLIDGPGKVTRYLEEAGNLWDQASYPAQVQNLGDWGASPAEPLLDRVEDVEPKADEGVVQLSSRPIEVEPAFVRERKSIFEWRNFSVQEMQGFLDPVNGGINLLAIDPATGLETPQFKLLERLQSWFERFPPEARARWTAQFQALEIPDQKAVMGRLKQEQVVKVLRAFHLFAKMFNGLTPVERSGFEEIDESERSTSLGMARVLALLSPRYLPPNLSAYDSGLAIAKLSTGESRDLQRSVRAGDLFGGSALARQLVMEAANVSLPQVLGGIDRFVRQRTVMQTPEALEILNAARSNLGNLAARGGQPLAPVAGYYIARLFNYYLNLAGPLNLRPWNLNGYFGQVQGQDYLSETFNANPSIYELWTDLDLISYRLRSR